MLTHDRILVILNLKWPTGGRRGPDFVFILEQLFLVLQIINFTKPMVIQYVQRIIIYIYTKYIILEVHYVNQKLQY